MAKLMVHGKTARNCLARGVTRLAAAGECAENPAHMAERCCGTSEPRVSGVGFAV